MSKLERKPKQEPKLLTDSKQGISPSSDERPPVVEGEVIQVTVVTDEDIARAKREIFRKPPTLPKRE